MIEVGDVKDYLGVAAIIISFGGAVYAWMTARSQINAEHLKRVDESLKTHDRRIQRVENELEHLPSKESQHNLEVAMADLNGEIKAIAVNMAALAKTTERMEEFLMKRGDE